MITKDDIAAYRATYPREYWERQAEEAGSNCVAPFGAVLAVNALCYAYEEIERQRDELLAAMQKAADEIRRCDYTPARSTLLTTIASVKGQQ